MANRFWVGGTGNWSDNLNHWSASTGGAANATLPGATDNVFFDASSFSGAGQIVTVDAAASCLSMDWTGATNSPTLAFGSNIINYSGNLTFIAAMTTTSAAGAGRLDKAGATTSTLTTNGLNMACRFVVNIAGGAVLSLQDNLTNTNTGAFHVAEGTLLTNNKNMTLTGALTHTTPGVAVFTLGSSTITCAAVTFTGANQTLTANTSVINCAGDFAGNSLTTYNTVNPTGATCTISGSNTYNTLALPSGTTQTITFTDSTIQTATTFTLSGDSTHTHTLQGSGAAGWALAKAGSPFVSCDYMSISRSTVTPSNTWYAGANSTDGGNNSGWRFRAPTGGAITAGGTIMSEVAGGTRAVSGAVHNIASGGAISSNG
jgi:hypothetical protein